MSGGAGPVVNPTNGRPGAFTFLGANQVELVDGSSSGLVDAPVYSARSGIAWQRYRVPLPEGF